MSFWLRCNVFFYVGLVLMNIFVLLVLFPNNRKNTHQSFSSKLRQELILHETTTSNLLQPTQPRSQPGNNQDSPSQPQSSPEPKQLLSEIPQRFVTAFSGWNRGGRTGVTLRRFDPSTDTFVHVHMQKTGGSQFGRLLLSLDVGVPCRHLTGRLFEEIRGFGPASFRCRGREAGVRLVDDFLVSRYSLGWICGVHASFDRLRKCVPRKVTGRKMVYISNLRDPVERVISEYFHGIEGWADNVHGDSKHWSLPSDFYCNGTKFDGFPGGCARMNRGGENGVFPLDKAEMATRRTEKEEVMGMQLRRISLFDYLLCPATYKNNRQTKMLALDQACVPDSGQVDEENLVQLATRSLLALEFFGLAERMRESQLLFEYTFGVKFRVAATALSKRPYREYLKPAQVRMIEKLEHMDMAVYRAAQLIFEERLKECGSYCSLPVS